jgi:small subunit ribosomal protein S1
VEQGVSDYLISDDVRRLATRVSIASRIEPELLRAVRLRLLPDVDVSAESDLWFSDLVEARSTLRIVLRPDVASTLWAELASDRTLLEAARHVIADLHVHAPPAIRLEEEIIYLALRKDDTGEEINNRLMAVLQAIAVDGRRGLVDWAARALPRMPEAVMQTPAGVALNLVSGGRAARETMIRAEYLLLEDPNIAALIAAALPKTTIQARLITSDGNDRSIELSCEELESSQPVELPQTEPLLVELSDGKESEIVEIPRKGSARRRVEGLIFIRTLAGALFELLPHDDPVRLPPNFGDVIQGTIISISGDDVFVSYGGSNEAVMDAVELEGLGIGDSVSGTVTVTSPQIRIARTPPTGRALWKMLRQIFENRLPVEGKIISRNKGGFDVNIAGLRAFCPLSQIALGKIDNPDAFIGSAYEFRVTEMSDDGRRIVVSRAVLLREAVQARAEELRRTIFPGAELIGRVKTITPFGAFVDLGGIDGLLHVSEMSRRRVTDPKEIVHVGQEVRVQVIRIENDGKRVTLSMKHFERDPWDDAAERYVPGSEVSGRITRVTDFGYFVEVEPGLEGLVHNSQLPLGLKLGDPSLRIGVEVSGWVREIDTSKKRLSLSFREVPISDPWTTAQQKYPIGKVVEGIVDHTAAPGVFVELEPGLSALIPNSEIGLEMPPPGTRLPLRVMGLDPIRKRISLSHDAAIAKVERDEYVKFAEERGGESKDGDSVMAAAFRRAMEKKNKSS